jgi:hypothetical protein
VGDFSPRSIWLMALMDRPQRSASALKEYPWRSRIERKRAPTLGSEFSAILSPLLLFCHVVANF